MALALCLLFDLRADRLIRDLWARLEEQGIRTLQSHTHGQHHPHLSYAVLLDWDAELVRQAAADLPRGGAFEVTVQGALVFPRGRVALAPSVSPDVAARQERAARALGATGAMLHHHYAPGRWVPHISVATRATGADLGVVVTAVSDLLPLTGRVDRAALIDSSTGEMWTLDGIP